jgi:polyhydroxybutyrate depolymerase
LLNQPKQEVGDLKTGILSWSTSLAGLAILLLLGLRPTAVNAALMENLSLQYEGITRVYDLYIPTNASQQPAALIVDLHGFQVSKTTQRLWSKFDVLAEQEGFYVAFPAGVQFAWNSRIGWIRNDDVGFLRELVAQLVDQYDIDPNRVYATGHSMGGEMVYRLACEAADFFAAFSTVATTENEADVPNCHPSRPVPVLSINGLTDPVYQYYGDRIFQWSAPATLDFWRQKNACTGTLEHEDYGPHAWCDTDRQCGDGVETALCTVTGDGDSWSHVIYRNTAGLDLAELSWNFFQNFTADRAETEFQINAGLNDAWVSAEAPFQGFFFTVYQNLGALMLSWFTFDSQPFTENTATFGASDQRWVTGLGSYTGNTVTINVENTSGGVFNLREPLASQDSGYGTITLDFKHCNEALLTYHFPASGLSGEMNLTRVTPGNVALCEALSAPR